VPTRRLFSPLHTYPYLKDSCRFSYPQAERIFEQGINIPASTVNDEESTLRAAEIIRDAVLSMRR
jgi:Predicted pyridoxal phosphate-dependent enzyme apparently involved in regulation of cell wall biogenesis